MSLGKKIKIKDQKSSIENKTGRQPSLLQLVFEWGPLIGKLPTALLQKLRHLPPATFTSGAPQMGRSSG